MRSTKDKFKNPNRFHEIIYKGNISIKKKSININRTDPVS